jgi:2'-5' RNA ligase
MSHRSPGRVAGRTATAILVAATALGLAASCSVRPAPAAGPPAVEGHPGGSLFSTIPCAATPLGAEWSKLLAEAGSRFPRLRLTRVEDLHITIVYLGADWKIEDLETIRALALVGPREAVSLRPEVVRMGRKGHVVAVEMHGAPEGWATSLVAAKDELNRRRLKKAEEYDASFRPHVTLASARQSPPDDTDVAALDEFRSWLAEKIAEDEGRFGVTVGPRTPVRLWLAGMTRPPGAPAYVDLADALTER